MDLTSIEQMARAAKERADKATPGPWETYPRYRIPPGEVGARHVIAHAPDAGIGVRDLDFVLIAPGWPTGDIRQTRFNFEQMAAARQDVPALADALLSLVARVRELEHYAVHCADLPLHYSLVDGKCECGFTCPVTVKDWKIVLKEKESEGQG